MAKQRLVGPKQGIEVRVHWQDPSDLPTLYANQVYITHAGGEFYVVFGELQQPVLVNLAPDELGKIAQVEVKPVAKLVLTHEGIVSVLKAIGSNVANFEKRQEREKEGKD